MGTRFTIFDTQSSYSCGSVGLVSEKAGARRVTAKQISPSKPGGAPGGSYMVANIAYELNVLGSRGPRRMQCSFDSIPLSSMELGGSVPPPSILHSESMDVDASTPDFVSVGGSEPLTPPRTKVAAVADCSAVDWEATVEGMGGGSKGLEGPLVLKNKVGGWDGDGDGDWEGGMRA